MVHREHNKGIYIPFIGESLAGGNFTRMDEICKFPYKFKHGTILTITPDEYEKIKNHDWSDKGYQ